MILFFEPTPLICINAGIMRTLVERSSIVKKGSCPIWLYHYSPRDQYFFDIGKPWVRWSRNTQPNDDIALCVIRQPWFTLAIRISSKMFFCRCRTMYGVSWWCHQMGAFSRYGLIARGIHRSPVKSPHKGQYLGASLICAWMNGWVNNREAADLRCHRAHYDVTVMYLSCVIEAVYSWHIYAYCYF